MNYQFKNPEMEMVRQRFANYLIDNPPRAWLIHETEYQRFAQSGEDEPSSVKISVSAEATPFETVLDVCLEDAEHFASLFKFRKIEEGGWTVWLLRPVGDTAESTSEIPTTGVIA